MYQIWLILIICFYMLLFVVCYWMYFFLFPVLSPKSALWLLQKHINNKEFIIFMDFFVDWHSQLSIWTYLFSLLLYWYQQHFYLVVLRTDPIIVSWYTNIIVLCIFLFHRWTSQTAYCTPARHTYIEWYISLVCWIVSGVIKKSFQCSRCDVFFHNVNFVS